MGRHTVWLGDLARALHVCGADADAAKLARMFGFEMPDDGHRNDAPSAAQQQGSPEQTSAASGSNGGPIAPEQPPELYESDYVLRSLPPEPLSARATFSGRPLEPPRELRRGMQVDHMLLVPGWRNAIVSAASSTFESSGRVDLVRAVEELGKERPVDEIPRLPLPTVRRGVQLLVDVSPAMWPFAWDRDDLVDRFFRVIGRERVEVVTFHRLPGDADRWNPPPRGRPVIAVTDLGIARSPALPRRASTGDWLRLAERVRGAGSALLAIVPYPLERVPHALRAAISCVPWSRRTTASMAKVAARRARTP